MRLQSVEKKKNNLESTCIDVEDEACREVAVYKATAFLAISTYGYQFVYSDCCRSGDIENFLNPENEGFTLISTLSLNGFLSNTDRKSTRLNSSHVAISYAVFCLKKKNITRHTTIAS